MHNLYIVTRTQVIKNFNENMLFMNYTDTEQHFAR